MAVAKAPAMTTRQAKRLGKKQTAQFQFTASQLRRADRQEEIEKREKKKQEREQKKILNKRKREEQEEKQQAAKRRLLDEGKISIEDTWGRVTRSQSRLHSYFTAPIEQAVKRPTTPSTVVTITSEDKDETLANRLVDAAEDKENQHSGPKSNKLTNKHPPLAPLIDSGDEMLDCHRLKVASHSCNSHLQHRSLPMSASTKSTPSSVSRANPKNKASTVRINSSGSSMTSRSASSATTDTKEKEELLLLMTKFEDDIIVAEDETAEIVQALPAESDAAAECFSAPPDSFRSALSEMTVANVNTRAQEKPDTTSVPECSGLTTPSKPRDPFAGFNSGDFDQDCDVDNDSGINSELTWDKENADPFHIYTAKPKMKATAKLAVPETEKSEAGPSSCHKRLLVSRPPSCKRDDFEDIYDVDFDTGEDDDFADDEVDDATLMTLSTQKPPSTDRIVDVNGSPHRPTTSRDALAKSSTRTYTGGKTMLALSPTSKVTALPKARASTHTSPVNRWAKEPLSFNSICDDDWLDIVEQVEEELSQKGAATADAAKGKEREGLPPQPPHNNLTTTKSSLPLPGEEALSEPPALAPSTQYYLMLMADDIDNDRVFQ